MNGSVCDWIDSSPSLSELDDNDLDTGFGGHLNCGLKLEDGPEFVEPLMHNSPEHFYRDEMNLSLNSNFNRRPKLEPNPIHSELEYTQPAQNNSPDTQMDIYRDLILRQLIQDFSTTSSKLSLPTDPNLWTIEQTKKWVNEACDQFNIRAPLNLEISGKELMHMSQDEFCKRIPEGGDTLHAQFQLWKTAFESHNANQHKIHNSAPFHPNSSVSLTNKPDTWNTAHTDSECAAPASHQVLETTLHNNSPIMPSEHMHSNYYPSFNQHQMQSQVYQPSMISQQSMNGLYNQTSPFHCNDPAGYYVDYTNSRTLASPSNSDMSSSSSMIDEDPMDSRFMSFDQSRLGYENGAQNLPYLDMPYDANLMINNQMNANQQQPNGMANFQSVHGNATKVYPNPTSYSKNSSGSIHLWHFIRELLDNPKDYSNCVRWVDRAEGTFKIESSHNLARLWGARKNRSAMNFDKLSRSLRQYYKKKIIQKPLKKQRLVYQFLPPYNSFTH